MGYIRYRTFSDGIWDTVYCVKFDMDKFYYIQPLAYEWLKKLGKEHMVNEVITENQPFFVYETHQKLNDHNPKFDEDIMSYQVPDNHVIHIGGISSFFYYFRYPGKEISTPDRFERAMLCTFPKLPIDVFERMISYQLSKYEEHEEYDTIVEKVNNYIKKYY